MDAGTSMLDELLTRIEHELLPGNRPPAELPDGWAPRKYQENLWGYLDSGGTRAVAVWHRRSGKDSTAVNWTARATQKRVGLYWHMLPEQTQARKVIWNGIDSDGRRLIDQAFPPHLRASKSDTEMRITMPNGSVWQCVGSDRHDSLVGSNPVGVVFSEYSLAKPSSWDYIRPILAENGGWAVFLYTPRGRNHGYDLYEMARTNPGWHCELLGIEHTGAISEAAVEEERAAGMSDEMIAQEFHCSFHAAIPGSYFGRQIEELESEGHVTSVPWEPSLPVYTAWDLGMDDQMAVWFLQVLPGGEKRAIEYLEHSGEGLEYYVRELASRPYTYGKHYAPHDIQVRELGTGKTRWEVASSLGVKFEVLPKHSPADRVQAIRSVLPTVWFDEKKTQAGLEALRNYRRDYDEKLHTFRSTAVHDWASHGTDAFGHFAVGYRPKPKPKHGAGRARAGTASWMGA